MKNLEKSNLRKEIELCLHINGEEINNTDILLVKNFQINFKILFKKQTFQESYNSVVSLATQKYTLVLGDTDKIIFNNLENFYKI